MGNVIARHCMGDSHGLLVCLSHCQIIMLICGAYENGKGGGSRDQGHSLHQSSV